MFTNRSCHVTVYPHVRIVISMQRNFAKCYRAIYLAIAMDYIRPIYIQATLLLSKIPSLQTERYFCLGSSETKKLSLDI